MTESGEKELLPLFQEMIRNACVNTGDPDSGHEHWSADTLERFFLSRGIKVRRLECRKGRTNLLVRIPGTVPGSPSLMYMGHTDVVPARAADWAHPPFGGELIEGEIWGRGAVDMLNMTASMAVGLANALDTAGPFPGDLAFLAVADEEASGTYGARWLTSEHWDLVHCDYMITELGGFHVGSGRKQYPTITLGEKGIAWLRLVVKGVPGHGSLPFGSNNSICALSRLLVRLGDALGSPVIHPMYKKMADAFGNTWLERKMLGSRHGIRKALRRLSERSPGLAAFLHTAAFTSVSPTIVHGGEKVNVIPDRVVCDLDIRLLPGEDVAGVCARIKKLAHTEKVDLAVEVLEFFPSTVSRSDTRLMQAILLESGNTVDPVPMMIGGVTDGRFWRQRGTTVYGYVPFDQQMNMGLYARRIHGIDERISLDSLQRHLRFFTELPEIFYR